MSLIIESFVIFFYFLLIYKEKICATYEASLQYSMILKQYCILTKY